jgi:hypothetical protein
MQMFNSCNEKMLNITNLWDVENQKHNVIAPHPIRMDIIKKVSNKKMLVNI